MADTKIVTAASCLRSARQFNIFAVASTVLAAVLFTLGQAISGNKIILFAMSLPPVMLWLAASIFVYAMIGHHPDLKVRHYNKWAGYRYYAVVGFMTIMANDLAHLPTGWNGVWGLFILALVPWALYDIWKAGKENWQDIQLEPNHE